VKTEIVARTDIVALVRETVELRRSGASFLGLCPFHAEKTPSFNVHPGRQIFHCFGCGKGGDAIAFLMERDGLTFPEALTLLAGRVGVLIEEQQLSPAQEEEERRRRDQRSWMLQVNELACSFWEAQLAGPQGQGARAYLERRGISPETITGHRVGYAPDSWDALTSFLSQRRIPERVGVEAGLLKPRSGSGVYDAFRDRVITPVFDLHGRVVAFSGRLLEDRPDTAKYINSPETPLFRKGSSLFGIREARTGIRQAGRALLVEGNFDLLSLHQAGFLEAVAPLGTALTREQLRLIARFSEQLLICYDGDRAGREAALKAALPVAEAGLDARVVRLPDGDDPDSFLRREGADAFRTQLARAVPLIEERIRSAAPRRGAPVEARLQALEELLPVLRAVLHPLAREHYLSYCSEALELDEARIRSYIQRPVQPVERPSGPVAMPAEGSRQTSAPSSDAVGRSLLELLVDFPELAPVAARADVLETLPDERLRRAVATLYRLFEEEGPPTANQLLEALEAPEDRAELRRILAASRSNVSREQARERLDLTLTRLYQRRYRTARSEKVALRSAAAEGDDEQIKALLAQRERRQREKLNLKDKGGG